MSRLPKQDWVDTDALDGLDQPDPLRAVFARSRARRGGQEAHEPSGPTVMPPTPRTGLQQKLSDAGEGKGDDDAAVIFAANAELSGAALKVLVAALQRGRGEAASLSQLMQAAHLSKNTVIAGVRECLDWGWLTRRQACPRCEADLPETNGERVSVCDGCGRSVAPRSHYTVQNPHSPVHKLNRAVEIVSSPVQDKDSPPVQEPHRTEQKPDSLPVQYQGREAVQKPNRYQERVHSIISRSGLSVGADPAQIAELLVHNVNRSHARADSESIESNYRNDSDSSRQAGTGSERPDSRTEEWRRATERMAQESCRDLEASQKSLGFHIKAWNHARQLDCKVGSKLHTEALYAILAELRKLRQETGRAQGRAWTQKTRSFFEKCGSPLLTQAEWERQQTAIGK